MLQLVLAVALAGSLVSGDAAGQQGSTIQLPTFGVAVDAEGVLTVKAFPDPGGRLHAKRVAAAKEMLPRDVAARSEIRKVSLVALERAVRKRLDAGEELTDAMKNLAGLQRVRFVFFYPDTNDVVIAGPAEGWAPDGAGRMVGLTTGRPVVMLEDLLTALRTFPPGSRNRPFVGCTIEPTREGLMRLQKFQRSIPRTIPQSRRGAAAVQIAQGCRQSLGMSNVKVFGVPPDTHFARVLIEADHRMKLIGIGLHPPPVRMTTFLGALGSARHSTLQRWWFTPNYDCVKTSADGNAMGLVGQGVQLQNEDKVIGPNGKLINSAAKADRASELFTTAFTKKYPEIAAASPVYAQMRNLIDLTVAAAYLRKHD